MYKDEMEGFLTVQETAAYLRVTEQTIYNWCKEDVLPYVRIGNRYRIFKNRIVGALIRYQEKVKNADSVPEK